MKKLNLWRVAHALTGILKMCIIIALLVAVCVFGRFGLEVLMRHFVDIDATCLPDKMRDMLLDVLTVVQLFTFGLAMCAALLVKDNKGRMRRMFKSVEQLEQERASIDDIIKIAKENRATSRKNSTQETSRRSLQ